MDEEARDRRPATDDLVRGWVHEDFALDLVSLAAVEHGADDNAQLWRGSAADGTRFAVKLRGGGNAAGLVLTAHLTSNGVREIAAPIPTRQRQLWSDRDGRRLSVVPWVSDNRALSGPMGAAHWRAYGELLAQVHATAPSAPSAPSAADELARLLPREDHTHAELAETARAAAREWPTIAEALTSLVQHADRLGPQLRARPAPDVICHGDPHLGNVLLGDAGTVWLVDWDDAVLAPRELDLMFVIGGVLASAPVTGEEQSWFFDGYGDSHLDRDLDPYRLAYYRCTRALIDLVDWATWAADPSRPESDRAEARDIVDGLISPTGLVTLALRSARP